ncbi:aldo/keto reductase family oxidoreductase [Flavobacterium sp.]|uniref:aldo/keto reductase n=1 Tax=Flavobacterium sp. TaxID=239 RepID=UPI0035296A36
MIFSSIIAGVMNWGVGGKNLNSLEMQKRLHLFLENNITTFDHADIYGGYTTEEHFGKALLQTSIKRENIQLISKCGIKYPCKKRNYSIKHYDYSKDYILWSVDESLKNLQTDYLDALLLHRPSPLLNTEEVAEAVSILKEKRKIKHFGVSNFLPQQIDVLQKYVEIEINQIQFSATHYKPLTDGQLDYMQAHTILPMAWNPLGSIFKEETEQTNRLKLLLADLFIKYEVSADLLLLKWIQQHPSGVLPVVGTTDENRIKLLQKLEKFTLELDDWFKIWTTSMGHKVP